MRILLSLSVVTAAFGLAAATAPASAADLTTTASIGANVCQDVAVFGADFASQTCAKGTNPLWTPVRYIERGGGSVGASKPGKKYDDNCGPGGYEHGWKPEKQWHPKKEWYPKKPWEPKQWEPKKQWHPKKPWEPKQWEPKKQWHPKKPWEPKQWEPKKQWPPKKSWEPKQWEPKKQWPPKKSWEPKQWEPKKQWHPRKKLNTNGWQPGQWTPEFMGPVTTD